MAKEFVPPVEPTGVGTQQPPRPDDKNALPRLDHEMKMIGHQAKGVNLSGRLLASLSQRDRKLLMIEVIVENGFAAIATTHNVVNRTRILNPQLASGVGATVESPLKVANNRA